MAAAQTTAKDIIALLSKQAGVPFEYVVNPDGRTLSVIFARPIRRLPEYNGRVFKTETRRSVQGIDTVDYTFWPIRTELDGN